jgi:hypothetical protein
LPVPARPSATGGGVATANPPKAPAGGGGRTVTVSGAVGNRSATTSIQVTGGRTSTTGSEVNRTARGSASAGGPRLLWDYQTNLRIAERPIVGEKHMLVVGTGREAVFLDNTGGKPQPFMADAPFSAPVGRYGEVAYAACSNGTVYALHLPTRLVLWEATVNGAVTERPMATDDDLFVVSERGGLTRFVRANGELLWQNPAAVRFVASNPKFVYARDGAGRLLILDRGRGTTLTKLDMSEFTYSLANGVSDRLILAADDGLIVSLHDRAYVQPLRLRNPPAAAAPVAGAPATPDEAKPAMPDEAKPETPAEPGPAAKPGIKPRPPAVPKPKPAPTPPPSTKPEPTNPPVTPPPAPKPEPTNPPVTPPLPAPPED